MRWVLLIFSACLLAGCRAPSGGRSFVIPAERYTEAFELARAELRRAGYTLERVDANAGELLTAPKTIAGFATPFQPEYTGPGQRWQDTLNNQPRTVQIRFRDAAADPAGPATPPTGEGGVRAEVEVVLWRFRRPGWRLETESIQGSTFYGDPAWSDRGVHYGMLVPIRRDDAFAGLLADRLRRGLGLAGEGG
jgi:hypothetical protein